MSLRPCLACGEPVAGSYCEDCQPARPSSSERDKPAVHRNPAAWKALSKRVRRLQPWCLDCGATEHLQGDHIIPVKIAPELALVPIGAYAPVEMMQHWHMNPEEALDAFEMVGGRHMVPMHFETYPLSGEPLHEPIERLEIAAKEGLDVSEKRVDSAEVRKCVLAGFSEEV